MDRRKFFGLFAAVASAGAFAAIPMAALAEWPKITTHDYPGNPQVVPHVYLAGSECAPISHGPPPAPIEDYEIETWRHTTDRDWRHVLVTSGNLTYEERYNLVHKLYLMGRPR